MVFRKLFVLWIFLIACSSILAQQNDNNPYSRYGIGQLTERSGVHLRQMGGLGASYMDAYHINIVNPASYAFLSTTAFDIGLFGKYTSLKDNSGSNNFWSGNLDYVSLAFPLFNPINEVFNNKKRDVKIGMNIALRSNSSSKYDISVPDSITNIGKFDRNYTGSGGTYNFLWGSAIKYKDLSFGTNLGYTFGNIKRESSILYPQAEYAYNVFNSSSFSVKGFFWDAGLLYAKTLNNNELEKNKNLPAKRITAGIHFSKGNGFDTKSNIKNVLVQYLPGSIVNIDTILVANDKSGKGKLGGEYGFGATYYYGEKFALGFNVSQSLWSNYENGATDTKEGTLSNSSRYSIGGFYRPNYNSITNFLERIYYRYGVYYEKDPLNINGKQVDAYGLTMGFGFPMVFQRKISHSNISFNFGERGRGTFIEERFVKISLGVTFNDDEWFVKRKYY